MNRVSFLILPLALSTFCTQKTAFSQSDTSSNTDIIYSNHIRISSDTLTLEDCLVLISRNKHLRRIQQLLDSSSALTIKNLKVKSLPSLALNGQYAYLSDPFRLTINSPSVELALPQLSSPQNIYQGHVGINQLIYNGWLIRNQNDVALANAKVNAQQTEVEIYELKGIVVELYFSVLLLQEQEKVLASHRDILQQKIKAVEANVAQGKLTPDNAIIIKADLLKVGQEVDNVQGDKRALLRVLSNWIQHDISLDMILTGPIFERQLLPETTTFSDRPESKLFQFKGEELEENKKLSNSDHLPMISAFGTIGYGSPVIFNPFDETPGGYYLTGLTLKWNFFTWGTRRREHSLIRLQQQKLMEEENLFHQRLGSDWLRSIEQYNKLLAMLEKDKQIIEHYAEVLRIVSVQLENGLITATAYTEKLNMLKEAELIKNIHASQLSQEHYNILFQTGKL